MSSLQEKAELFGDTTSKRRSVVVSQPLDLDTEGAADAPRPATPAIEEERKDADTQKDEPVEPVVDTPPIESDAVEDVQAAASDSEGGGELLSEERRALQESARAALDAAPSGPPCTATDESNAAFNKTAKAALEALRANDPSYSIVDLTGSSVLAMKHTEYVAQIADALRTNTYVTEVRLGKCELDANDAKALAAALEVNNTLRVLNLEKNKISNDGATALASGLKANRRLVELNLLGQPHQFGDACLEEFVSMFDFNVTLTKIIWRLESRKSFAINKLVVRNNTIKKWLAEARDVSSKVPPRCNVPQLLALTGGTRSRSGSIASLQAQVPAKRPGVTDSPAASPLLTRAKPSAAIDSSPVVGSPSMARHRPAADASASPASPSVARKAAAASAAAASPVVQDAAAPAASPVTPAVVDPAVAAVTASPSTDSPMARRRALLSGSGSDSAPGSPASSSRRLSTGGSLRSKESPNFWVSKLEQNDPTLTSMVFEKDVSLGMKHREYIARLATALATATHLRELVITQCELDSVDAKAIADALITNRSLRVLDLSKNKITNEGSAAIAEALKQNSTLNEINLIGQPHAFGENCLESWLSLFEYNISLRKIIWRLDSRKSFPINKSLVRNNSIKKFVDEGRDTTDLKVPEKANCALESLRGGTPATAVAETAPAAEGDAAASTAAEPTEEAK